MRCRSSLRPGVALADSARYRCAISLDAFSGRFDSSLLIAEPYSVASRARVFGNVEFEGPIDGIMASPMAISVVHCALVSTSPSGSGGRGLARGAMRFNCWEVILIELWFERGSWPSCKL